MQWNNVREQHELNQYIVQMHHEFGIPLISTADSHYPNREAWKDRELYKRLGWLGKGSPQWLSMELPIDVEDVGYELYPKNGDEMWEAYEKYSAECKFEYDDDLVLNSIEETHRIAYERIESFFPDNTVRLPDFVVPYGLDAIDALAKLCMEGARTLGFADKQEYIDRLDREIEVIDSRGFSRYFPTMKAITDRATKSQ